MKQCLHCKKEFDAKTDRRKFCSDSCRVMYNRKYGNNNKIKPLQMQVLYNRILELISENKIDYSKLGIQKEMNGQSTAISTTSRYELGELKTFQQYMNEISELQYEDEYRKKYEEIKSATNLTEKQKNLLFTNMNSSKL